MRTFDLNETENKHALDWMEAHKNGSCCPKQESATGGRYSFIFTPTGLGIIAEVRCNVCGECKALNDSSQW